VRRGLLEKLAGARLRGHTIDGAAPDLQSADSRTPSGEIGHR